MNEHSKLKIAVIGGGIAGAELARNALPGSIDLTIIEPKRQIECQALYPEYLVGAASLEDMTAPLKPFCDRVGANFCNERAIALDKNRILCDKSQVDFDIAVVATGATQNYYGIMGADETFSVNTLEEAKRAKTYLESRNPEKIVIIGSGLTGIETAFTMVDRLGAHICILEAKERVLPQFSENISAFINQALKARGIDLLVSSKVSEIREGSVKLYDGTTLDCDMAIWTAGIKPPQFVLGLPFPKENDEWIRTDSRLYAGRNVFALGDSAWIESGGKVASKTAVEAEHQAKHMAKNLARLKEEKPLKDYAIVAPTDAPVALISLSCDRAMGVYGNMCITVSSRLIHSLKGWIDKSFVGRFK